MRPRDFLVYRAPDPISLDHARRIQATVRELTGMPVLIVEGGADLTRLRASHPNGRAEQHLAGGNARAARLRRRKALAAACDEWTTIPITPRIFDHRTWSDR